MTLTTWQFVQILLQTFWWVLVLAIVLISPIPRIVMDLIGAIIDGRKEKKVTHIVVTQEESVDTVLDIHKDERLSKDHLERGQRYLRDVQQGVSV